jgi:hypothetical protein
MTMTARCGAACRATEQRLSDSCSTRDKWWEAAGCVDCPERVQLQRHAKLVAIQTEARPAVQSTQPANDLHVICVIHTVSQFHGAAMDTSAMARNVCLDLVFETSSSHACSHSYLGGCTDCVAEALSAWQTSSLHCWHATVQLSGLTRVFINDLEFHPHPRMLMQLSFRPHPRMPMQLHTLCAIHTPSSFPPLDSCEATV